ncbi:unnamed protein product [Rhizophagus irregularis]|nr:unnamed protein product [Rhizophagus irregularis]
MKEIVREFKIQHEVGFHDNIIRYHGISKFKSENNEHHVNYILHHMAYQLACGVSCLHNKGIAHCDLHSGNILDKQYDVNLTLEIAQGLREEVAFNTPEDYIKIYTKCWDGEPDNRPTIYQVVDC